MTDRAKSLELVEGDRAKPLELVLRYGDIEVVHVFPNMGDFEAHLRDATPYFGIPLDVELIVAVTQEVFLNVVGLDEAVKMENWEVSHQSPFLRKLVAELVESVKAGMK